MNVFLTLTYLFFIGSVSGWVLELFFRKLFSSSNPEHKWINLFGIGKDEEMISRMNVKYVPGFFRNDDLSFCSYSHSPCIFPFWSFHLN